MKLDRSQDKFSGFSLRGFAIMFSTLLHTGSRKRYGLVAKILITSRAIKSIRLPTCVRGAGWEGVGLRVAGFRLIVSGQGDQDVYFRVSGFRIFSV